jgi:hypothetical protein
MAYEDPGGKIVDPFEGDLSSLLASDADNTVDTSTLGTYTVTYTMTEPDVQNLRANPKTRTVIVVDTTKPVRGHVLIGRGGGGFLRSLYRFARNSGTKTCRPNFSPLAKPHRKL